MTSRDDVMMTSRELYTAPQPDRGDYHYQSTSEAHTSVVKVVQGDFKVASRHSPHGTVHDRDRKRKLDGSQHVTGSRCVRSRRGIA